MNLLQENLNAVFTDYDYAFAVGTLVLTQFSGKVKIILIVQLITSISFAKLLRYFNGTGALLFLNLSLVHIKTLT